MISYPLQGKLPPVFIPLQWYDPEASLTLVSVSLFDHMTSDYLVHNLTLGRLSGDLKSETLGYNIMDFSDHIINLQMVKRVNKTITFL